MGRAQLEQLLREMVEVAAPDQLPLYDLEGPLFLSECLEGRNLAHEEDAASMQFGVLEKIQEIAKGAGTYLGIISSVVGTLKAPGWLNRETAKKAKVDRVALRKAWASACARPGSTRRHPKRFRCGSSMI